MKVLGINVPSIMKDNLEIRPHHVKFGRYIGYATMMILIWAVFIDRQV